MPEQSLARLAPELDQFARLGQWLAASEKSSPNENDRGAAAALRLYFARELGLPPLVANEITLIKGRLVVSAQLLRALANRAGYRVIRQAISDTECTASLIDQGGEILGQATFTLEDARRAGLIRQGSAWQTHPQRMLWARASSNVVKDFAPAVALGLLTVEEAAEIPDTNGSDANADFPAPDVEGVVLDEFDEHSYATPGELGDLTPPEPAPDPVLTIEQRQRANWLFQQRGFDREDQPGFVHIVTGRTVHTISELTTSEADKVIEKLEKLGPPLPDQPSQGELPKDF